MIGWNKANSGEITTGVSLAAGAGALGLELIFTLISLRLSVFA